MKIKLNVAETLASKSATKKPSYHIVKSSNGPTIVIDSKYKPVVAKAATSLKQAKTLGVAAAKLGQATAKLKLKLKATRDTEKKAPISAKIKANNAVIKKDVTAAKKLAASAIASLAKAGLKVLSTPIRPSYITSTQPDYTISKIGKAKADNFWVKASGANRSPSLLKPRFATGDKFDKIGASSAAKKSTPGAKPSDKPKPVDAPKKKPSHAEAVKRAKKVIADKRAKETHSQPHLTKAAQNDAANQSLRNQSKQWDKDTRMSKRMLKELNGGKSVTTAAGWTGTVEKGKGVFTNKHGQKMVVKKSDMAKYGLTPDSFKRALGESNIKDTNW